MFSCRLFLVSSMRFVVENAYITKMASSRKIHCRVKNNVVFFSP